METPPFRCPYTSQPVPGSVLLPKLHSPACPSAVEHQQRPTRVCLRPVFPTRPITLYREHSLGADMACNTADEAAQCTYPHAPSTFDLPTNLEQRMQH